MLLDNILTNLAILRFRLNESHKIFPTMWWALMPGQKVKLKWPSGWTDPEGTPELGYTQIYSADPNDHYRPWMEKHVGKQKWDWNWDLEDMDVVDNTITLKVRKGKEKYLPVIVLKWGS